jgi:hypothetical protein
LNTFGCKVNGQIWLPYFPCYEIGAGSVQLQTNIVPYSNTSALPLFFWLTADDKTTGSAFLFRQNYTQSDHIYSTGNIIDSVMIHYLLNSGADYINTGGYFGDTSPHYFRITKLDTSAKIISGIFAFTLYAGCCGTLDSVVITEGRFDLTIGQYSTCSQ